MLLVAAAVVFAGAGCGGGRCAHDTCEPGSEFDAVVAVPDTVAGGDATDASGADAGRDGVLTDVGNDNGDDAGDDVGENVLPPYEWACKVCTLDADCGQGAVCDPVGAQKHCINECRDDGDCAKGFFCYEDTAPRKYCLPVSFNCVACVFDEPCDAGKCCDFNSGTCKDCGGDCSCCLYDFDCGEGFRCFKEDGYSVGMCVPECVDGACADADNYTCVENARGVEMCIPNSDGCPGCTSPTPWPLDCVCVECRDSSDCLGEEVCIEVGHTCAIVDCVAEDEIPCKHDGQCHECCDDSDCLRSGFTGVCLGDGTCQPDPDCQGQCTEDLPYCVWVGFDARCVQCVDDDDCVMMEGALAHCNEFHTCESMPTPCDDLCSADFPVCTVIDGVEQCVQCASDEDCAMIGDCTCSGDPLYSCVDSTGAICGCRNECYATCEESSDCPPAQDNAVQDCVQVPGIGIGYCVDPSGHCDGISSCCGAGQTCYDLVLVMQEIYPTVPRIIPHPDVTLTYCGCDTADDCLTGDPCTELSILCTSGDFGVEGLYELICPDGQLHEAFPDRLCVQPATLLEYFGLVPATDLH